MPCQCLQNIEYHISNCSFKGDVCSVCCTPRLPWLRILFISPQKLCLLIFLILTHILTRTGLVLDKPIICVYSSDWRITRWSLINKVVPKLGNPCLAKLLSYQHLYTYCHCVIWLPKFKPVTFHAWGKQIASNKNPKHLANYLNGIRLMPLILHFFILGEFLYCLFQNSYILTGDW